MAVESGRLMRRDGHRDSDRQILGANSHPEHEIHRDPLRMGDGIAALLYRAGDHEYIVLVITSADQSL
jgi:hypothetical protein